MGMYIQIMDENRQPLAEVVFNTVQIVRCIKRNRAPDDSSPITQADIARYLVAPILAAGEDYKRQMAEEDAMIVLAHVQRNPGDLAAALAAAQAEIAVLNDPLSGVAGGASSVAGGSDGGGN